MKRFFIILFSVLIIFTTLSLSVSADTSEVSRTVQTQNNEMSSAELAVTICVMFVTISVVGVLFLKTVMKNNNKNRIHKK